MNYSIQELKDLMVEAKTAARDAAVEHLNKYGEHAYCGFAWVNIYDVKGNTKLGRAMKQAGYQKSYDGSIQIYNPAGYGGQSMDVKEHGAQAAAAVFESYGFRAYMGSRAD